MDLRAQVTQWLGRGRGRRRSWPTFTGAGTLRDIVQRTAIANLAFVASAEVLE